MTLLLGEPEFHYLLKERLDLGVGGGLKDVGMKCTDKCNEDTSAVVTPLMEFREQELV